MNVDFVDPSLVDVIIPPDFLNKTYIGRCSYDFAGSCSKHGGELADFNIWSRALTETEMLDWTTCR